MGLFWPVHSGSELPLDICRDCSCCLPQAKWTPPDFDKYGKVSFHTDKTPQHYRNLGFKLDVSWLLSMFSPTFHHIC